MLDETRAHFLQDVYYISNRNPIILSLLHNEVNILTKILFDIYSRKIGFKRDFTEDIWNASTNFISMYLKHPNWRCKSFRNRLYLEVKYQLHNPQIKRIGVVKFVEIPETLEVKEKELKEDVRWILEDIKFSQPEFYSTILFDCYRARTYKSFILKLSTYVRKRWIYDHSSRLHNLYKNTRRNK